MSVQLSVVLGQEVTKKDSHIVISDINSDLIKKLPAIWEEYLQALGTVKGTINKTNSWIKKGKIDKTENLKYNIAYMYHLTLNSSVSGENVFVTGDKYDFRLLRADSDQTSWLIDNLERKQTDDKKQITKLYFPSISSEKSDDNDKLSLRICSQLAVGLELKKNFIYLPELWKYKAFVIQKFHQIGSNSDKKYFLKFKFFQEPPHKLEWLAGKTEKILIEGELYLTTDYFLIEKGNVKFYLGTNKSNHFTGTYENVFDSNVYKVPLPKLYNFKAEYSNFIFNSNVKYDLRETEESDLKRFTLSHYGVPEPDFDGKPPISRIRYILACISILIIIVSICVLYLSRRRKTK
ncbi:MAG: hypothetical protein LBP59_11630 [Planctomycetaceae bacterium]|nr:hypothetical protein [Planctomycetaceae bacterium]